MPKISERLQIRRNVIIVFLVVAIATPFFISRKNFKEREIRTHIITDYLDILNLLSRPVLELSMLSSTETKPTISYYGRKTLQEKNREFQGHYRPYRYIKLGRYNSLDDFLGSVNNMLNAYFKLIDSPLDAKSAPIKSRLKILDQFFDHNATYARRLIVNDKGVIALEKRDQTFLKNYMDVTFPGISQRSAKDLEGSTFIRSILKIKEALNGANAAAPKMPSTTSQHK